MTPTDRIYTKALEVYKTDRLARQFIELPHMMLGDKTPIEVAADDPKGADRVIEILGRLQHGSAA
ncbi:MAG: hypothetical protein CMN28_00725 [Salinisphaeraceae bacterium]|nr:hypothetical protein [Salinisphaeraceae bacterium]